LSNCTILKDVQCLLQLGSNFSLPSIDTRKDCFELIINLENNEIHTDTFIAIRNRTISILNNLTPNQSKHDHNNMRMLHLRKLTNEFIKNNSKVIFTRADKGNIIVTLDQTQYKQTISLML